MGGALGAGNSFKKLSPRWFWKRVLFEFVEVTLNPFVERGVRGLRSGVPAVLHPRSEESRGEAARGPRIGLILRPL